MDQEMDSGESAGQMAAFPPIHIGRARISRIEEQRWTRPATAFSDGIDFGDHLRRFSPNIYDPQTGMTELCFHSWLIDVGGLKLLVDPCNGNGRLRPGLPGFEGLDTPWLARLADAGAPAEAIDIVVCTHLHCDHCGWNTIRRDGRWVPTFPNALYYFSEREHRRWHPDAPERGRVPSVYTESVLPVIEAGQARIHANPCPLTAELTIEAAYGHSEGHSMLRLASDGETAYFTGDAFHHPVQIADPTLGLATGDDPAAMLATRRALIARIVAESALIFPAHFAEPHFGRIVGDGEGFRFFPAG